MKVTKELTNKVTDNVISYKGKHWCWGDAIRLREALNYALEAVALEWAKTENIVAVRAATSGPTDPIVGYATGQEHDIKAFFDDQKEYGLTLTEIHVDNVPYGFAEHRESIVDARDNLQAKVNELNRRLKARDM